MAAMVGAGYPGQHWTSRDPHLDTGPRPLSALDQLAMPVLVWVGKHDVPGFREMQPSSPGVSPTRNITSSRTPVT